MGLVAAEEPALCLRVENYPRGGYMELRILMAAGVLVGAVVSLHWSNSEIAGVTLRLATSFEWLRNSHWFDSSQLRLHSL